ncbi:MAG: hypothetical protein ABR991_05920, partial [Terracidiphilus sp.]
NCSCQKAHSTWCNTGLLFQILLHSEFESAPPGPVLRLFAFPEDVEAGESTKSFFRQPIAPRLSGA